MESEIINTNELHSVAIHELATALSEASKLIEPALKQNENPFYKSKYADLQTVDKACRTALSENGLVVSQVMDTINAIPTLVTILIHKSGQWLKSYYPIIQPVNEKLADRLLADPKIDFKTLKQLLIHDPQAIGSAITYARRYSLAAICGVVTEDDDGEAATKRETQTQQPERKQSEKETMIAKMNNAKSLVALQSLIAECPAEWKTDAFDDFTKKLKAKFTSEIESELKEQFDAEEYKAEYPIVTAESLMTKHSKTLKPKGATK